MKKTGLRLSDLAGVVLLDGAGYDIPKQVRQVLLPRMKTMYTTVFTDDEPTQRDASPVTHVAKGKDIPPFPHPVRRQPQGLEDAVGGAGGEAPGGRRGGEGVARRGQDPRHDQPELGQPNDTPTQEVFEFLRGRSIRTAKP